MFCSEESPTKNKGSIERGEALIHTGKKEKKGKAEKKGKERKVKGK